MTARDREGLELSAGDVVRVAYGGDLHEAEISGVVEPHMDTGRWDVELVLRVRMPAGACTWVRGPSSRIADRPSGGDPGEGGRDAGDGRSGEGPAGRPDTAGAVRPYSEGDRPAAEDSGVRAPEVEAADTDIRSAAPSGSHEEKADGHEGSEGHRRTRKTGRKGGE